MSIVGTANEFPCPDCNSFDTYTEIDTKSFELWLDCLDCGTHMHLIRKLNLTSDYYKNRNKTVDSWMGEEE